MVKHILASGLFLAFSASSAADPAAQTVQPTPAPSPSPTPLMVQPIPQAQAPNPADASLAAAIAEWNRLRQTDSLPFASYAAFLTAHPGWPGESAMRRTAERAIDPDSYSPARVNAYFDRLPPVSAVGHARHAVALAAEGRTAEAQAAAREAWVSGTLSAEDEARLLARFRFAPADHDERMDRLLWAGATTAAARQLPYTSPAKRALFHARLAMRTRAADAAARANAIGAAGMADAGFVADRASWLRSTGQSLAARSLLAGSRSIATRPGDVEEWYEVLLETARGAANDEQWTSAYNIARQVDDALAPGADVRDQPLGVRDDYTSLVWLAGTVALHELRLAADAATMFDKYALAARSPQTQSKGWYWAGRAAQAAGRGADADRFFQQAARHSDQFYGQLALEKLGRPLPAPGQLGGQVSAAERQAFSNREIVRAARWLGRQGEWRDQTQFLRAISASVETDADHVLATELAQQLGRPDLAVMVGRVARADDRNDYVRAGYPQVPVPTGHQDRWTIIHAIARQESQFDRQAVSHAGARGMMQLMPGTAREQAGKLGLGYDAPALTRDIAYNIRLGSSYFQRMHDLYGSYPLALAAYNAGPGNVNRWLRANGDPRTNEVDMLVWIEEIPIYETKNYVQRVLENAVVYDMLNPAGPRVRSTTPLSAWLGTRAGG